MRPILTPETLLMAYAQGIFPMSEGRDSDEVFWVDPKFRGVIPLPGLHISRSLARRLRRGGHEVTVNTAFAEVLAACADREETWINPVIADLYRALHQAGAAHSLEVREGGRLVGGVYGVALGGAFFGESMFSRATDGSKLALAYLCHRLVAGGFTLFDVQFLTPHLASMGAVEVPRADYRAKLSEALLQEANFHAVTGQPTPQEVMQRATQTS